MMWIQKRGKDSLIIAALEAVRLPKPDAFNFRCTASKGIPFFKQLCIQYQKYLRRGVASTENGSKGKISRGNAMFCKYLPAFIFKVI